MVRENEDNSDAGFAQIKPAAVNLTAKSATARAPSSKPRTKRPVILWLGFGALVCAAAAVVFLLPRWVTPPAIEPITVSPRPAVAPVPASAPSSIARANTPWERAQQSKLRKETQEILAQMLETQDMLMDNGVEAWAADEYAGAMQIAETGDDLYNAQDFQQARAQYDQALTIFKSLVDQVDDIFAATMDKGHQALIDGDSATAADAFGLALAIDPLDRHALTGRERADTLDVVLAMIEKGDDMLEAGRLEDAKAQFEQAIALDGESALAKQQLQVADDKIRDRAFNRNMSAGFSALGERSFQRARQSFAAALKIKPNSVEARGALHQSDNNITAIRINGLIAAGTKLEGEERWHDALSKYKAALKLDAALADAQAGRERAGLRAKIDDKLADIIARPKRLYDPDVHRETVTFHRKISAVSDPGPKLAGQIKALAVLLEKAITPISIRLQSDNLTKVTMYKIGELGYFSTKELTVRPGRYVALGYRDGYLDARTEFEVEPGKPLKIITIQATTKIASKLNSGN